ncbi:MAG: hypothetical protein ACO20H_12855 [Bacteriovoracaceae bacterium]
MKVAILGQGPSVLETALKIHQLGGSFKIFSEKDPFEDWKHLFQFFPELELQDWNKVSSEYGRTFVNLDNNKCCPESYFHNYFMPIWNQEFIQQNLIKAKVKRISKRFLDKYEQIPNRSRVLDLFRVVYDKTPNKESLNELGVYDKFDQGLIEHLEQNYENYEDFDFIVDASENLNAKAFSGLGGEYALNESNLGATEGLFYGAEDLGEFLEKAKEAQNIIILGDDVFSVLALKEMKDYLHSKNITLLRPSKGSYPLALKDTYKEVLRTNEDHYKKKLETYHKELEQYEQLEDYEKVKVKRPNLPERNIQIVEDHTIVSMDRLYDHPGNLFVSTERADFQGGEESKTITAQVVGVFKKKRVLHPFYSHLQCDFSTNVIHPEPGFYTLGQGLEVFEMSHLLNEVDIMLEDWAKFFSKRED